MTEPCLCGDPSCGRCFPQWRETAEPECDICGEPSIEPVCEYTGTVRHLCAKHADDEPGDRFYEGRG